MMIVSSASTERFLPLPFRIFHANIHVRKHKEAERNLINKHKTQPAGLAVCKNFPFFHRLKLSGSSSCLSALCAC